MKVHPAADLFPMMTDNELRELADDIRENGLREEIKITEEEEIMDGRNRLAACQLAEVEPRFVTVSTEDPVAYVVSLNVKRRNLTKEQLAVSAAEAWPMYEIGQGTRTDTSPEKSGEVGRRTVDILARLFGVNETYVQQARALLRDAPDVAEKIKRGEASLPGSYDVYQQTKRSEQTDAEEIERLERDLALLRSKAKKKPTVNVELLPPPTKAQVDAVVSAKRPSLDDAAAPKKVADRPVEIKKSIAWEKALASANESARLIRDLPEFPQVSDAELTALQAAEVVRLLGDAAARILNVLPETTRKLRSV